jgi:hypothetical protein
VRIVWELDLYIFVIHRMSELDFVILFLRIKPQLLQYVQILFISDSQYAQLFFLVCTSTLDVYTCHVSTCFVSIESSSGTA